MENRAMDLIEIDAASNRGIDEIRELRERIRFAPTHSKYKVFVIDEAHQLTDAAFNALLKTLEEPPAHAIFILATTEAHKMLPTILSRVQRFDFKKLSLADVIKKLEMVARKEQVKISDKALRIIALNSEGFMRDAESMLGQVIAFSGIPPAGGEITVEDIENILGIVDINLAIKLVEILAKKESKEALSFIDKFVNQGYDLIQFMESLINYFRKLMLLRVSNDLSKLIKEELSAEQLGTAVKQAEQFSPQELSKTIEILIETLYDMKRSSFQQINMELAVVEICNK
jgi:DNA polymerase-3 subunit gamma/tau